MGFPQASSNPALTIDSTATHVLGGWYMYEGEVYQYVQFADAVTYAAKQPVTFKDRATSVVTNDVSNAEDSSMLAGFVQAVMTENSFGFIKKKGTISAAPKKAGDDSIAPHTPLFAAAATDAVLETRTASAANAGNVCCWAEDTSDDPADTVDIYFDCP